MAEHNKTLLLMAHKLGLEYQENVLNKAAEFERLLQAKSTAGCNISDSSKVVICLDLAASFCGVDLESKLAIKYSGLKPNMYRNSRLMIEKILEINNNVLTTSHLCLALECTAVQDLANSILNKYREQAKMEIDLSLPQYVCMAVHQACRLKKLKLSKNKLIKKSRLKPAQWNKLDADWTKFVDERFACNKNQGLTTTNNLPSEENQVPMEVDYKCDEDEPEIEPYEVWKKRILEQALKEMEEERKMQEIATKKNTDPTLHRTSPRKGPRFSPYKSPNKGKRVTLTYRRPVLTNFNLQYS